MQEDVASQMDKYNHLCIVINCSQNSISVSRKANTERRILASGERSLHAFVILQPCYESPS